MLLMLRTALTVVLLILANATDPAKAVEAEAKNGEDAADRVAQGWPEASRAAAAFMLKKYGAPQEMTSTMLIWRDNAPWTRTVVHKVGAEHDFPVRHQDVLEQTIVYKVPLNFYSAIATYNGSVIPDRTRGTVTSFGDSETTNILSLNLTRAIVRGELSAEKARDAHVAAERELLAGRTPETARDIVMQPQQGDVSDPDTAMLLPAEAKP